MYVADRPLFGQLAHSKVLPEAMHCVSCNLTTIAAHVYISQQRLYSGGDSCQTNLICMLDVDRAIRVFVTGSVQLKLLSGVGSPAKRDGASFAQLVFWRHVVLGQ